MEKHKSGNTEFYHKAAYSRLSLADVFSDVFKKHEKSDGERLFLAGTKETTPEPYAMLHTWKKPWLFIRVLGIGMILLLLLYVMIYQGYVMYALTPFAFIGAAAVPLAIVVLFWELNIPRNIPIYEVLLMVMIGGIMSLLFTGVFNSMIGTMPAYLAPLTEEPAKFLALYFFLRKPKRNYILNGVLIGGAIGAGFAFIETTGYFVGNSYDLDTLVVRAFTSPGTHTIWAAIYGGALAMAAGRNKVELKHMKDIRFLGYFGASFAMHFIWNSDFTILSVPLFIDIKFIVLILAAWICLLSVIDQGVKQVLSLAGQNIVKTEVVSLYCIEGPFQGNSIPLTAGEIRIGRDPGTCNLLFPAATPGISRKHCTIYYKDGVVSIMDDGSSQGTYLADGTRLEALVSYQLPVGSRFYLASKQTLFEIR